MSDSKPHKSGWELQTLDDYDAVYRPDFLIGKHIVRGWSHIFYGTYGCLKTKLAEDMAVCASGNMPQWLKPITDDEDAEPMGIEGPVKTLYLDFDNGVDGVRGDLAAFTRGHGRPPEVRENLRFDSWPSDPIFKAIDQDAIDYLKDLIVRENFELVIIDNTKNASGVADENSSQMGDAIENIHKAAHATGAAVVMLMNTGFGGKSTIRGHSSMMEKVDALYYVEREAGTYGLTVTSTKFRSVKPRQFSALFDFEPMPNDDSMLKSARMVGVKAEEVSTPQDKGKTKPDAKQEKAETWIVENLLSLEEQALNVTKAALYVKDQAEVGRNNALYAIKSLKIKGVLAINEQDKLIVGPNCPVETVSMKLKRDLSNLRPV